MLPKLSDKQYKSFSLLLILAALVTIVLILLPRRTPINEFTGYYTIGALLNTVEIDEADMEVVKLVIKKRVTEINEAGGINGKELRIVYLDDKADSKEAYEKVKETIDDKHLIGYVGCWSSTRAKAVSELVGPAKIPFIGGYALTPLFENYPNMFSAETSIKETASIFEYLLKIQASEVAFIGKENDIFSEEVLRVVDRISDKNQSVKASVVKWYPGAHQFSPEEIKSLADTINQHANFLILSFESGQTTRLVRALRKEGVKMPIFTALGDLGYVTTHLAEGESGELFDLNVLGIPGTLNLRLQELLNQYQKDLKQPEGLLFQLSFGSRIADAIGLMAEAARTETPNKNYENIREKIVAELQEYIGGEKIYRGWLGDWYFTENRSYANDILIAWKPADLPYHVLAPVQFMRTEDTLQEVPVIYTHIDMVQVNRVRDSDGSFFATFYLELSSVYDITIKDIDFTNAARSITRHEPLLEVKLLQSKKLKNNSLNLYNRLYRVSGKFYFDPDLRNYPFDTQRFPISFQPVSALHPFFIQPPGAHLRDTTFDAQGWNYLDHYVGYDHEIISFVNNLGNKQQILPFYKFSYTYVLKRARVDFFLKVLTPLLVILVVTYFSVYIPLQKIETLEAIQVTSLLASIALYFSAYKPEMENATISDKIFIFTYIMVTSLIGTTILRYVKNDKQNTYSKIARIYQRLLFPLIVVAFIYFITR